jgi:hypothetical protein
MNFTDSDPTGLPDANLLEVTVAVLAEGIQTGRSILISFVIKTQMTTVFEAWFQ